MRSVLPARLARLAIALALGMSSASCSPESADDPTPWLVFGIDGAEWRVIEAMWAEGGLPHLRELAQRGVRARLKTAYGKSPIIWTSIATGVTAERHGIVDFVIPTENGDVPLSSKQRKVPAIWTVMTLLDRPVAVFGWWATWPAESVNGMIVSDRFGSGLEHEVFPEGAVSSGELGNLKQLWAQALTDAGVGETEVERANVDRLLAERHHKDAWVSELTGYAVAEGRYHLTMSYVRTVDVTSHLHYGCWNRELPDAPGCDPQAVRTAYSTIDAILGSILNRAAQPLNVMVLSDHGFYKVDPRYRVSLDFDRLLEHLGYLARDSDGRPDIEASRFVGYRNPGHTKYKNVRRLPAASDRDVARLRAQLESFRYATGGPVFRISSRKPPTADTVFVVEVIRKNPSHEVSADGIAPLRLVDRIVPITGSHGRSNDGILIAAGPDVADGTLDRAHIFDIAPTLAYGLGLPVARDADGKVREELFNDEFRRQTPRREVSSWGSVNTTEVTRSEADEEILEELRALGYLD